MPDYTMKSVNDAAGAAPSVVSVASALTAEVDSIMEGLNALNAILFGNGAPPREPTNTVEAPIADKLMYSVNMANAAENLLMEIHNKLIG